MSKQHRTTFGVVIPPWRTVDEKGCLTMQFVLTGLTPSKKNRMRATFNYSWVMGQVRQFKKQCGDKAVHWADTGRFVLQLVKNIHPYLYKPQDVLDWEVKAKATIVEQAAHWKKVYEDRGLIFPVSKCSIKIKYYWADNRTRDNVNKNEAIYDILTSTGIIADDNYTVLFREGSDSQCFKDKITDHITQIWLTAYSW